MKCKGVIRRVIGPRLVLAALAGSVIALAGGSAAWGSTAAAAPAGFKLFTSAVGGYQLVYPAAWSAKGASLVALFRGPTTQGVPTVVGVNPLGPASPFGSVDTLAGMLARLHSKKGTTTLSQTKTHVAGSDARVITTQEKSVGVLTRAMIVVFLSHNRAWMISYSATSAQYARTAGAFRTMLASFTFIK